MAGVAPRIYNGLIEFLLLPIYFLLHMVVRRSVDARILKWRREEQSAKGACSLHFLGPCTRKTKDRLGKKIECIKVFNGIQRYQWLPNSSQLATEALLGKVIIYQ